MSIWSFGSSPQSPSSTTMTFAQAKKIVSRIAGAQNKPDEVGAGDAIQLVLDELNRTRWDFLSVRGSDIAIVDNRTTTAGQEGYQGTYTLPVPFKDPISLLLTTSKKSLTYIPRGQFDALKEAQTVGGTLFYTNFNQGLSGRVQLLDAPTSTDVMEIRYYRPIMAPAAEDSYLDVPADSPMLAAVIVKAQYYVGLWRGVHSDKIAMLRSDAAMLISLAKGDDQSHEDRTPVLVPQRIWAGRAWNSNSPYWPDWWW